MSAVNLPIDDKLADAINSASQYKCIKRVGILRHHIKNGSEETAGLDFAYDCILIYDYDESSNGAKEELLEYIEDIDTFIRHIFNARINFVCYNDAVKSKDAEFRETAQNDIIWIYRDDIHIKKDR